MKFKPSRKVFIALIIIVIILIWIFVSALNKSNKQIEITKAKIGTLVQEISETGVIKQGETIDLSFKTSGQISNIYVNQGDKVKAGQYITKLDNQQLSIQLLQAKAQRDLAQAELDKLLAGATEEEIQSATNTVNNKEKDLENTIASTVQSRINTYEDALNNMADSYLYVYNAYSKIKEIQNDYFPDYSQDSLAVKDAEDHLKLIIEEMEFYLDKAEADNTESNIDYALNNFEINLSKTKAELNTVRTIMDKSDYKNTISSADKTSVDTHRGYINTELVSVVTDKQAISSVIISNKSSIDLAQAALTTAQDSLTLLTAEPRDEDIALYQAQLDGAQANVSILQAQLNDTYIVAPFDGTITNIEKYVGEVISPSQAVASIIPSEDLEIEVDIYEEDVVSMKVGNPVRITLVAFPDYEFIGRVIFINPSEKLVDGIVYYETHIAFEELINGVKPGMSADVDIVTLSEDNILMASDNAIYRDNGDYYVILKDNKKHIIEIGRKGNNDMVEILSGLEEGQELIVE